MFPAIKILLYKELKLELRRKAVIAGIGLYLLCIVFVCYITFNLRVMPIQETIWSALFWLTVLFSVVNTVAKSFIGEKYGTTIYLYSVASPAAIIISKIVYNSLLCFAACLAGYALFLIFIDNPVRDLPLFVLSLLLASVGFSAALTLISSISSRASNSNILMAVLSFPLVLGILLMAMKINRNVIDGLERSASYDELLNLFAINCIVGGLAYLLFPYIWRS